MQTIIDTELATRRKLRAHLQAGTDADFLMREVAEDLGERLSTVGRRFPRAAILFSPTDAARRVLLASGKVDEIVEIAAHPALGSEDAVIASADHVPIEPASLDLAVSLLALHELNDIPGMLIQIRRALKPDGLFLGVMAGAGTLSELRESLLAAETEIAGGASPRVLPFADVKDAGALLQRAGFALPVADTVALTVRYDTLFGLMRDLRAMGVTNPLIGRSRVPSTRALFTRAAEIHAARFGDADGRIRSTFSLVWLSGWAPAATQPKPLAPGSARASLASALSVDNGT